MRRQREQGRRTYWRWRGSATESDYRCDCKERRDDVLPGGGEGAQPSQITDATAKRAGTTYVLEVERERNGVRVQMRLQREEGRRTSWRWRGSATESEYRGDGKESRAEDRPGG